jgi:hypothetical protein
MVRSGAADAARLRSEEPSWKLAFNLGRARKASRGRSNERPGSRGSTRFRRKDRDRARQGLTGAVPTIAARFFTRESDCIGASTGVARQLGAKLMNNETDR